MKATSAWCSTCMPGRLCFCFSSWWWLNASFRRVVLSWVLIGFHQVSAVFSESVQTLSYGNSSAWFYVGDDKRKRNQRSSEIKENIEENLGEILCQDICIPLFALHLTHLWLIFYHFGVSFKKLAETVCSCLLCFCGHLFLTGVDLLHHFLNALIFFPSSMPCKSLFSWSLGYVPGLGRRTQKQTHVCLHL